METKAGEIMKKLGWIKKRDGKTREYFYERPPAPADAAPAETAQEDARSGEGDGDVPF